MSGKRLRGRHHSAGHRRAADANKAQRDITPGWKHGARHDLKSGLRSALTGHAPLATLAVLLIGGMSFPALAALSSSSDTNTAIVKDAFTRTVNTGWGSADAGGAYATNSAASFKVAGGVGQMAIKPGSTGNAVLGDGKLALTGVDASVAASVAAMPTSGGGVYSGLMLRYQANRDSYKVIARTQPSGKVLLFVARTSSGVQTILGKAYEIPGTVKAGTRVNVEAQVTGTSPVTVQARAWITAAPSGWNLTIKDADAARLQHGGAVGVTSYVSGSSQANTVSFDGLNGVKLADPVTSQPPSSPSPTTTSSPTSSSTPKPSQTTSTPSPSSSSSTTTPPPSSSTERPSASAGSAPIGSTDYPVPAKALIVSPSGDDGGAGTAAAPYKTLAHAISAASNGATIVLRAGVYHESVSVPTNKTLTIQSYPHEAVWLDGSSTVDGWTASGNAWYHDNWTVNLPDTPCFIKTGCSTAQSFVFVNPSYPMAADPDQTWIDGSELRQVGSASQLTTGTFFVDKSTNRLWVGTNPVGRSVNSSDLQTALSMYSPNSVVRGIGIRRYGTSLPELAPLRLCGSGESLENVVVTDNAAAGILLTQVNQTASDFTVTNNGLMGVIATYADGLKVDGLRTTGNNTEHFNTSPTSAGIKVGRSRNVTVENSIAQDNNGTGFWFDESVYNTTFIGNDSINNGMHGLSLEISAKADVYDNLFLNNSADGIKINDTPDVNVYNNTIVGNNRSIEAVQDTRLASNTSGAGHDPRQALPDPTMTWVMANIQISNNVIANPRTGADSLLYLVDYTQTRTAKQMDIHLTGNVYGRKAAGQPAWTHVWSVGKGNPAVYTSLSAFQSAQGEDSRSVIVDNGSAVDSNGKLSDDLAARADSIAVNVPSSVSSGGGNEAKALAAKAPSLGASGL